MMRPPPNPATEVNFFSINGINDLAPALTQDLTTTPAIRNGENYYTINLTNADFAALATGTSTFALGFQGQGVGLLAPSNFILFGLDFAALSINTGATTPAIPEPPTLMLLLTGLGGLGALSRLLHRPPNKAFVKT